MLITKFWSAFSDTFSRQKLVKKTFFFFHGNVTDLSKAWIIAGPYCVNCELSSGIPSASKITKRLYYGRLQIMPHVNSENIIFFFQKFELQAAEMKDQAAFIILKKPTGLKYITFSIEEVELVAFAGAIFV